MADFTNSGDFYQFGKDPFFSNDAFRFDTGGASPALTGTATQLATSNQGTQSANAFRNAMARGAANQYRQAQSAMYGAGGAGNFGAMANMASRFGNDVNNQAQKAYAEGGLTNAKSLAEAGGLFAKADQLNQQGKNDSLNYLSRLKPEYDPAAAQANLLASQSAIQNGNFLPELGKGLLAGGLGAITGGGAGWLTDLLFGVKPNYGRVPLKSNQEDTTDYWGYQNRNNQNMINNGLGGLFGNGGGF